MNNSMALIELEKIFNFFNKTFWSNNLIEPPMFTIDSMGRIPRYGWCTVNKVWKNTKDDQNEYYEICICSEALNRSYNDIAETVLHEMIHLHNLYLEINDTSINGRYHNKRYKKSAEDHGLNVTKDPKFGWSTTSLTDDTIIKLNQTMENKNNDAFIVYRQIFLKNKIQAKKLYTYKCLCDRSVKSEIVDDMIICHVCNTMMKMRVK